ncbi:MAG: alpha/beta fold hydrolase, partial [Alphaproteobacteria bacterium]
AGLLRPDIFKTVTVMSAPFASPAPLPIGAPEAAASNIDTELAALGRPRKHYQRYYSTRPANADIMQAPGGLKDFIHAYFHMKSAGWHQNHPVELSGWTGEALAAMPTYYIMDQVTTMPEAVSVALPLSPSAWFSEADIDVYTMEYARTGFQGGLNWYRCRFVPEYLAELALFGGAKMRCPLAFIAGAQDWGIRQTPGAIKAMETRASTAFQGTTLIDGAGHWVQQEQPEAMVAAFKATMLT